MNYHVGLKEPNCPFLYLDKNGVLNQHKEQAAVFLSMSNAESARDKWQKKARKHGDKRKLYLIPIRE